MKQSGIVWFNVEPRSLSLIDEGMSVILSQGDEKLSILSSGPRGCEPSNSDYHITEPLETRDMSDLEYMQWCLNFAVQEGVGLFVPSRGKIQAARMKAHFEAAGVKVMVPGNEDVMRAIEHKSWLYELLADTECAFGYVPIPDWRVVNTLAEMKAAYAELRDRHKSVCFKPDEGIFGYGFRRIVENGTALDRLMKGGPYTAVSEIGWPEIEVVFGAAARFEDLLLMPYLPGKERSIDCIAHDGHLVACINRYKTTHETQVMEDNPRIEEFIELICTQLHLSGVFNVQFRESGDGNPFLLELNSRMSGGLHKACKATDFALPYWAVRVALGLTAPQDVPLPRTGAAITKRKVYDIVT